MDINQLMQMAGALKEQMQRAQEEAQRARFTGEAGGGLARVTITGRYEVLEVKLDPKAIDPADPKLLEDLVRAATNDALSKAGDALKGRMGTMASGMGLDLGALGIPGLR